MSASLKTTCSLKPYISRKIFPLDIEDVLLYSSEIYCPIRVDTLTYL